VSSDATAIPHFAASWDPNGYLCQLAALTGYLTSVKFSSCQTLNLDPSAAHTHRHSARGPHHTWRAAAMRLLATLLTSAQQHVRALAHAMAVIAGLSLFALMFLTLADVFMRYSGRGGAPGAVALVILVMVIATYLGIPDAELHSVHVRTPIATSRMPPRMGAASRLVGTSLVVLALGFMTYVTGKRAAKTFLAREVTAGLERYPTWPSRVAIPVGFLVLTLVFMMQIHADIRELRRRSVDKPDSWTLKKSEGGPADG